MNVFLIVFGSVVAEALIEYANMIVKDKKLDWKVIASALIGIGVALVFGVDLFEMVGVTAAVPYVGMVLTGVIISRGSNYIHDLLKRLVAEKARAEEIQRLIERPTNERNVDDVSHEV